MTTLSTQQWLKQNIGTRIPNVMEPPQIPPVISKPEPVTSKPVISLGSQPDPKLMYQDMMNQRNDPTVLAPSHNPYPASSPKSIPVDPQPMILEKPIANKPLYMPEIGGKRSLSNILHQSLIKTYNELKEPQVQSIIQELQLDGTSSVTKSDVERIIEEVRKRQETKPKDQSYRSSPISHAAAASDKSQVNNFAVPESIQTVSEGLFERNTVDKVYDLIIDSRDRYCSDWPRSNHFQIVFGRNPGNENSEDNCPPTASANSLGVEQMFHNVTSVQLVQAILPRTRRQWPYIIIEIEELGKNFYGSNQHSSKAFAKLTYPEPAYREDCYRYYLRDKSTKYFHPRIELSRMTISIKNPCGELISFKKSCCQEYPCCGLRCPRCSQTRDDNQESDADSDSTWSSSPAGDKNRSTKGKENGRDPECIFVFKVTSIQRDLQTMYLTKN